MTINITETIRKVMGWCPQERVVYDHNDVFFSENAYRTGTAAYDEKKQYMDIPIQMLALRRLDIPIQMLNRRWTVILGFMGLAIVLGFVGLILSGSAWTVIRGYMLLCLLILLVLLFIFDRTKLTVSDGILKISTNMPVFGDVLIPKNNIKNIEITDNDAKRHKLRTFIALTLMIMLSVFNAITSIQNSAVNTLHIFSIIVFVFVLYIGIRRSSYQKMIKMKVDGKDILLYPRNEHDFLMLKSIAPEKIEQQGAK